MICNPSSSNSVDWRISLNRLEGAYSDNTLRACRADITAFEAWCQTVGRSPFPASPEAVAAFVRDQTQNLSTATLKRRLAAIRKVHRLLRMENPVTDEEVVIAMRRALRGKQARPHQALGLTRDLRDQLIAACPDTLSGKRDRAMVALGYDTLCRRSELVALRAEDLSITVNGSAQILIRRSKNDPYGQGRLGYVSPKTLEIVNAWLAAAKIESGFIFRSVRGAKIARRAMHPYSVNRILKYVAERAALPPETIRQLSGHSMRVGAAQDMIASGLSILPIMRAGGWKTMNVVARYVENADLAALMLETRRR